MAHEGLRANDWRNDSNPCGHELAARPLHSKDQNQNAILGFETSYMAPRGQQNLIAKHQPRVHPIMCKLWVLCYSFELVQPAQSFCSQVKTL